MDCPECGCEIIPDCDDDGNRRFACANCDYGHTDMFSGPPTRPSSLDDEFDEELEENDG